MTPQRPNILLITSDQHRGDCFGFAGRGVKTPHLDRLSETGTRFSCCQTPNPVCQPARASILTGMLPLSHGVVDNGINLDPAVGERGFGGLLTGAGYDTAFIGKAHFATKFTFAPTGTPECQHSSADFGEDWNGPYMGFQHVELALGTMHRTKLPLRPPHGQHFERWFAARGYDQAARLYKESLVPEIGAAQTWHTALPVAWHPTTWIGDRAVDYLSRQTGETPFCLWASFPDPHHPFDPPAPWSFLHDPEEVDLSAERMKDLDRRPWWHEATLEGDPALNDPDLKTFRKTLSRTPDQTDAQLRQMTANYYGMISLVDHTVGRILVALEESGLAENTLVVFTSDHGDLLGDHGLYLKGPTLYEGLLRVGMLMRGPGIPAGKTVADPVSTLDLAATFYDFTGVSAPDDIQSRSLRPVITGESPSREVTYCEWDVDARRCGVPLRLRTVRTRTHRCTFELNSGAGELYDLVNDPGEMRNLFDDPGYGVVRRELREIMRARPGPVRDHFADPVGMA